MEFRVTSPVTLWLALASCSSEPSPPPRIATPAEMRHYYPELFVVVTQHPPPPGCWLVKEDPIVARGDDPQALARPAGELRANFVLFLGTTTILTGVAPHVMTIGAVQGLAYWCPGL